MQYEGPFSCLQKDRGKLTRRRAFDSVQKEENKKVALLKNTEKYARAQVPA
jgi:hypothetical protein